MIYELRTHHPAPDRVEDLLKRFQTFTMSLLKKHGLEVMGFWATNGADRPAKLVYLLRFPNEKAREAAWKAFRADPQWAQIKSQSEASGALVESIDEEVLTPTAFSPMQ
jgi:hypothetical protein